MRTPFQYGYIRTSPYASQVNLILKKIDHVKIYYLSKMLDRKRSRFASI